MRVVLVGGGSGGHVTPVLAVINELARHDPVLEAYFICDRKFGPQAENLMKAAHIPVVTKRVFAGKLRRYHGMSLVRQLLNFQANIRNVGDMFLIGLGFVQSFYLLVKWRPDVVFTKGGFVCLPAGLAAAMLGIPIVVHDSDAHPGLTNRVLARFASRIATGAPLENYRYPKHKSAYVGVPVDAAFRPYSPEEQQAAKDRLELPDISKPLVVVTGGGLGAQRINQAVAAIAKEVVPHAAIFHITGTGQFDETKRVAPELADYKLVPFVDRGMADIIGAADIVICRAGATTLLELAASGKATIIIPNAMLTGGHQVKNAAVYADAAIVVDESSIVTNPSALQAAIMGLVKDPARRKELGASLHGFARPNATLDTVQLIVAAVHGRL